MLRGRGRGGLHGVAKIAMREPIMALPDGKPDMNRASRAAAPGDVWVRQRRRVTIALFVAPVTVMAVGGVHYLISGWHRTLAAKRANLNEIAAEVSTGSMADALWMAAESNKEHDRSGSRRTNQDKAKAVKMALKAKVGERGHCIHGEYTEVANHVGVTPKMVRDYAIKLGYERQAETPTENSYPVRMQDPTPARPPRRRRRTTSIPSGPWRSR